MLVFIASILFCAYVFAFCELARRAVHFLISDETLKTLCIELIGTIQCAAPIFDVGIVLSTYGLLGVFVEIALLELVNAYTLGDALVNPSAILDQFRQGTISGLLCVTLFITELFGAYLAFPVATFFWKLALVEDHEELYHATSCQTDLSVPVTLGILLEGVAMFACRFVDLFAGDELPKVQSIIVALAAATITVLGIHLTGMYFNPIVASAVLFNCEGLSNIGHLLVYWVGPHFGWMTANYLYDRVSSSLLA